MKAMIRNMVLVLSAVSLVGCATPEIPDGRYRMEEDQRFSEAEGETRSNVTWVRYADQSRLNQVCGGMIGIHIKSTAKLRGCSSFDRRGNCTIYTHTNTTHQIFGHELRHCFQGNFH